MLKRAFILAALAMSMASTANAYILLCGKHNCICIGRQEVCGPILTGLPVRAEIVEMPMSSDLALNVEGRGVEAQGVQIFNIVERPGEPPRAEIVSRVNGQISFREFVQLDRVTLTDQANGTTNTLDKFAAYARCSEMTDCENCSNCSGRCP